MAPDINSLPPPRSSVGDEGPTEASPRAPSVSLAAAATINAGMQNQESRRSSTSSSSRSRPPPSGAHDRQRSAVMMNLSLNDPGLPGPGELQATDPRAMPSNRTGSPQSIGGSPFSPGTADPYHQRAPSLGELHQELEQEQEAQVNRLLSMIRQQEEQLQQLQQGQGQGASDTGAAAIDDSTPTSERSLSLPSANPTPGSVANPHPRSPTPHTRRGSYGLSRQSSSRSRTHSRGTPPPGSFGGSGEGADLSWSNSATNRDESVFYQAEAQMLTRENQMLKQRIRELERQLSDSSSPSLTAASPGVGSQLNTSPLIQEEATNQLPNHPGDEGKDPQV